MQSLGQLVLQRLASRTALWPEMYPADAHDAPLLPRQMHAITREHHEHQRGTFPATGPS